MLAPARPQRLSAQLCGGAGPTALSLTRESAHLGRIVQALSDSQVPALSLASAVTYVFTRVHSPTTPRTDAHEVSADGTE